MLKKLPFKGYFYFSIILNLVSALLILLLKNFLPPVVPLFYGLPMGNSQITTSTYLTIAPATGLVITVINIAVCSLVGDNFLKKTLAVANSFVSILLMIAVLKIMFLVGYF